jgi:hypothetical protein
MTRRFATSKPLADKFSLASLYWLPMYLRYEKQILFEKYLVLNQ